MLEATSLSLLILAALAVTGLAAAVVLRLFRGQR
jgi:hypothetical protein